MKTKPDQYDWTAIPLDGTLTTRQIVEILGCSDNTVRRRCKVHGGKVKPVPHSQRGQMTKLQRTHTEMCMKPGHDPTLDPERRALEGLSGWIAR